MARVRQEEREWRKREGEQQEAAAANRPLVAEDPGRLKVEISEVATRRQLCLAAGQTRAAITFEALLEELWDRWRLARTRERTGDPIT